MSETIGTDVKSTQTSNAASLQELETQLRHDLEILNYPRNDWIHPCENGGKEKVLDVLIIGGGQGGLAVAFGLMREKVHNLLIVDKNPEGLEGPWKTFARMITLRTPKYLTGPDHGIPNLTFRAWYEAQWGEKAWQELDLIPKEMWGDYLLWYRKFLGIPVRNDTTAGAVKWERDRGCFSIPISSAGKEETLFARKVVLATGIDGSGSWQVPAIIEKNLPAHLYSHTRHEIDFSKLKGKRVAVLGAGASAFDNASVALEEGAREVRLFFRRKDLPRVNPYRWAEFVGFLNHHSDLSDAERWRFVLKILEIGQLPPSDTYDRATSHENFHLHADSGWEKVESVDDTVHVTTPKESFEFDFVIVGTGFVTDLSRRPELKHLYPHIALWKDRYSPPQAECHEDLARHPYLGPSFEFIEKEPGKAPYLSSIFNYTFGCLVSLGFGGASISGMKYSLPKIVSGITRQIYTENCGSYFESLESFDLKEF